MKNNENFQPSIDEAAKKENSQLNEPSFTNSEESKRINYEVLPLGELQSQAKKLSIKNYKELNKQKLIDAIRNAKDQIFHS